MTKGTSAVAKWGQQNADQADLRRPIGDQESCNVGRVFKDLCVCRQIQVIWYLQNKVMQGKDSALFIKDEKFKDVPVRIYQPKAPSARLKKGVVFFHGDGWVMGSIQEEFGEVTSATGCLAFLIYEKQEIKGAEKKARFSFQLQEMEFLLLVLPALIAFVILLVVGIIYFDATNSEIPPGVEQPAKLRIIHTMILGFRFLGKILEQLHICSQIQLFRYLQSQEKQGKDPTLFIKDVKFKDVPVRIYQPKAPFDGRRKGVIFFHGGGWVMGSIHSSDKMCRYFSRESESVVVSVEYRLAPEHKYPLELNDCLAATTHFLETAKDHGVDPAQIIVAGESAGGNLAAVVCQALAGRPGLPKLRAEILIYPLLQAIDFNLPSYQQNRAVPFVFREQAAFYVLQYIKGDSSLLEEILEGSHVPVNQKLQYQKWLSADNIPKEFKARGYKPPMTVPCKDDVYEALKSLCSPGLSPLLAEDAVISQLPETCILTCEYDVLRDDGLLYKKRLEDHQIPVSLYHISNGFHGILSFSGPGWFSFPSGKKGMDDIVNFIKSL